MSVIKRHFQVNLKGMKLMQKKIDNLQNAMPQLGQRFIEMSLDYLYERAAYYIESSTGNGGYEPTAELLAGLKRDYELGKLFNDCVHAAWVEYGTGMIGTGTHPNPPTGYQYDANAHGEQGWTYPGEDGKFYHTQGLSAHRFMYNAITDYRMNYKKIFSKAFNEVVGGAI